MQNWLKISHHSHTGRLRPHEHTSYLPLALMVLLVGLTMAFFTPSSLSEARPGPEGGSVGLTGTLPQKPPKVAATITVPSNGQHFPDSPITVSGTCPGKTLIEIYKNDIFAGSALCEDNGTFNFKIDLLYGENKLVAKVYDVLNQAGPDSNSVTIFYDGLPPQAAPLSLLSLDDRQLLLNTDSVYRGIFPEQLLNIPVNIIGGAPPFAVNVQWGDAKNKIIPRGDNQTFNASHTYKKPGTYQITLQATDSKERIAFLTVAAVVNGKPSTIAAAGTAKTPTNKFIILVPLLVSVATLVASFWLGEMREKRVLAKAGVPV